MVVLNMLSMLTAELNFKALLEMYWKCTTQLAQLPSWDVKIWHPPKYPVSAPVTIWGAFLFKIQPSP